MKQLQRFLSALLCLAMLLAMNPVNTAVAAQAGSTEVEDGDIVIDLSGPATVASGTCGDNLTWVLNDGTSTISGTGPMEDYEYNSQPW